jgi:hypothetical protein
MAGVHRCDKVADMDGVEGPPENADSPGAAHARRLASARAPPRSGLRHLETRRGQIELPSPPTLVG